MYLPFFPPSKNCQQEKIVEKLGNSHYRCCAASVCFLVWLAYLFPALDSLSLFCIFYYKSIYLSRTYEFELAYWYIYICRCPLVSEITFFFWRPQSQLEADTISIYSLFNSKKNNVLALTRTMHSITVRIAELLLYDCKKFTTRTTVVPRTLYAVYNTERQNKRLLSQSTLKLLDLLRKPQ